MNTVNTYLTRTIVYEGQYKCPVCSTSRHLVRKDYDIDSRDFMHIPLGPGSNDYGRDQLLTPPPPIPEPDPIRTVVYCQGCLLKWIPEKIKGFKVVSDSAQEQYEQRKKDHEKWLESGGVDSVDSRDSQNPKGKVPQLAGPFSFWFDISHIL